MAAFDESYPYGPVGNLVSSSVGVLRSVSFTGSGTVTARAGWVSAGSEPAQWVFTASAPVVGSVSVLAGAAGVVGVVSGSTVGLVHAATVPAGGAVVGVFASAGSVSFTGADAQRAAGGVSVGVRTQLQTLSGLSGVQVSTPVSVGVVSAGVVSAGVVSAGVATTPRVVGVTATRFYRHASALVAVRTGGTGTVTDGLSWVVTDRQGTITAAVPAGSTTGSVNRYRPFGVNRAGDAITATARGFLARGEDPDGLVATDHRLYDPTVGRFLTIDPLLDQTRDPYGYGAGNPVTWSDPSGLDRFSNAWEDRYYQQGRGFGVDAGSVDQTLLALYLEHLQDNSGARWEDVRFIATRDGNGGYQQAARAALDVAGDAVAAGHSFITGDGALRSRAHPASTSGLEPISTELLGHESGARALAFTIAVGGIGIDAARAGPAARRATEAVDANVVMGRKGSEMLVESGTNVPGVVNGRAYSAHAFDQMQGRGIMPSVVDDTIATGVPAASRGATTVYYGAGNNISVVVNAEGKVVTVSYGDLRP